MEGRIILVGAPHIGLNVAQLMAEFPNSVIVADEIPIKAEPEPLAIIEQHSYFHAPETRRDRRRKKTKRRNRRY